MPSNDRPGGDGGGLGKALQPGTVERDETARRDVDGGGSGLPAPVDVMGLLAEYRRRYEAAMAEVDRAADELHRQETADRDGDPERRGEYQWAWYEAVMAQDRLRHASMMLDAVASAVGRMVDRIRGLGE